jgi:ABC-type branched-subunit amino acid transport system ATPase component
MLTLRGLVAGYGGGDVLQGVDLTVQQGSVTCIIGPNGAGKSTVLRVVSGLLKPRLGEVQFENRSIGGMAPRQILFLGIVQVPQERSLFPGMTVLENVRMGAYTVSDASILKKRLEEVQELFPIVKERAQDKAGNLSGGQQKMVEFARSLMLDPKLILLDEPSMGLDPGTLRTIFQQVRIMHDAGKTILLVEQNARSGLRASTHGVVMESGCVRLDGPAAGMLNNPEVGELYLGGTLKHQENQSSETATL